MDALFEDRRDAGRQLAAALSDAYAGRGDVIVLGLPRGGVPVAAEIARALHAKLDVLPVRKLGLPGHKEYAMGAIATGDVMVLDENVLQAMRVDRAAIDTAKVLEQAELRRREQLYRAGRAPLNLAGKIVIVVDDGLATGCTMRAAVAAIHSHDPAEIVVAAPVSSEEAWESLRLGVADIVCLSIPQIFRAVGLWYRSFPQTSDEEVLQILAER
ncbi:phosphoribosyltransferase [Allopusillimonas ginsengisoli]|uniref:phosphoribosyltransferase n=1 Tax=Allopusillimonas ginsengisoli TaxID=453575 RepID=UPI00101FD0CC|nr:phosphoribosyltransferase [Allopusillimonas ginsengisoli]TEA72270.1 phosphoribosyltransferase [Allopusillimonas ginsengisoli]